MTATLIALLFSLLVATFAIARLARIAGFGALFQMSGLVVALTGLIAFIFGPGFLPFSMTRYAELLGFGVAYLGQTVLILWLSFRIAERLDATR